MEPTLEELKEYLAAKYDEHEIVDMLEVTSYQLVGYLEEVIAANFDTLKYDLELMKRIEDVQEED